MIIKNFFLVLLFFVSLKSSSVFASDNKSDTVSRPYDEAGPSTRVPDEDLGPEAIDCLKTRGEVAFTIRDSKAYLQSGGNESDLSVVNSNPGLNICTGSTFKGRIVNQKFFIESIFNAPEKHILFFIHGFSVEHRNALENANIIQWISEGQAYREQDGRKSILVIPIIWGTEQKITGYKSDLSNSSICAEQLAAMFLAVGLKRSEQNSETKKFHILAHSMGNRVAKLTFRSIFKGIANANRIFNSVSCVAADVSVQGMNQGDAQNFIRISESIDDGELRVFHYTSKWDVALLISASFRVGVFRPNLFTRAGMCFGSIALAGFRFTDCSKVSCIDSPKNHSYFLKKANGVDKGNCSLLSRKRDSDSTLKYDARAYRHTETLHAILSRVARNDIPGNRLTKINEDVLIGFCIDSEQKSESITGHPED